MSITEPGWLTYLMPYNGQQQWVYSLLPIAPEELGWWDLDFKIAAGRLLHSHQTFQKAQGASLLHCSRKQTRISISWPYTHGSVPLIQQQQMNQSQGLLILHTVGKSARLKSPSLPHTKMFQSCLTLCNPIDCKLPGSSVHGILQTRILEWVAMPSSRETSWPRDRARVSYVSYIGECVLYH